MKKYIIRSLSVCLAICLIFGSVFVVSAEDTDTLIVTYHPDLMTATATLLNIPVMKLITIISVLR